MKSFRNVTIFLLIILQFAVQGSSRNQDSEGTGDKLPEQLKGLKSVYLVVFVDPFDISNSKEIGQKIEKTAKKLLCKAGLSLGSEQGAVLSIVVDSYTIKETILSDYLIIQVRTVLSEEATLKRDPSLWNPHGYHTWSCYWVDLMRRAELVTLILEEVKDQVEDFCSDWQLVRDLTLKDSSAKGVKK